MISKPQNDFKHTGHVGIDGVSFGDIAFLGNSQSYNHVPRQIVTPYKPSEDIEQTPLLLPPTPTSPDSLQSGGYFTEGNNPGTSVNPTFVSSTENTPKQQTSFQFPHYSPSSNNPFAQQATDGVFALQNLNYGLERKCFSNTSAAHLGEGEADLEGNWRSSVASANRQTGSAEEPHEYHEISDDEMTADRLDLGPSLLDEINSMFGSMSASATTATKSPDFDQINIKNEFTEITSKMGRKNSGGESSKFGHSTSKKKSGAGTVKQISVKDEKILNHAIEIANEISARSMIDLVSDQPPTTQSPKRKFSFRFPHLTKDSHAEKTHNQASTSSMHAGEATTQPSAISPYTKKKNFSEEIKSISDLQRFRSLSEIKGFSRSDIRIPLFDKETSDFCFEKSREILSRPLKLEPPEQATRTDSRLNDNIMDIEKTLKALNLDFMHNYTEIYKTDSDETILNERFSSLVSSIDDEFSSATDMFDFKAATNHLDKHLQYMNTQAAAAAAALATSTPKQQEDKRSSTPDTGFASRDTNISLSRRSSQKSSYSPQENYFNFPAVKEERFMSANNKPSNSPLKTATNASSHSVYAAKANSADSAFLGSKKYRERSMSCNDKFNSISPVLSEPQACHKRHNALPLEAKGAQARHAACYKPRSVRARTLRRLSYNPMMLASSSSSSSAASDAESDSNRSVARSECDIRARASSLYRHRRQHQAYAARKAHSSSQDDEHDVANSVCAVRHNKLYGSNVSIKSAPHYNYGTHGLMRNYAAAFDETIYDFGMLKPAPVFVQKEQYAAGNGSMVGVSSGSSSASAASTAAVQPRFNQHDVPVVAATAAMLHEFDVSRLTGKSPTSGNFTNSISPEVQRQRHVQPSPPKSLPLLTTTTSMSACAANNEFHWPEKIHASTVKQNELLWRQQRSNNTTNVYMEHQRQTENCGSSSAESVEFEFRNEFIPHIPPSPAP